ncbi:hypothetical protein BDP27DRAFT_274267 [Rhodocollybia butyracea]|uniref:Uncharacterized protein n=1 Tax=Rhodocollybia butyracea TaxID=206335 RepID=A0A9P5U0L0_9AGAR|nr:hypothetical protein BDP27DRAFT_274267 [Rhodocollybia butyracea]
MPNYSNEWPCIKAVLSSYGPLVYMQNTSMSTACSARRCESVQLCGKCLPRRWIQLWVERLDVQAPGSAQLGIWLVCYHSPGRFNARRSTQLILWELKLVIDFPHAATILLPSAVITHSNTLVHADDRRSSFTQFSAGAIFRWVENGCRTEAKFAEEDPEGYEAMMAAKATAIERRMAMFSTVEELCTLVD